MFTSGAKTVPLLHTTMPLINCTESSSGISVLSMPSKFMTGWSLTTKSLLLSTIMFGMDGIVVVFVLVPVGVMTSIISFLVPSGLSMLRRVMKFPEPMLKNVSIPLGIMNK